MIFDAINLPNYGLVANLPEGAILEVPAIVGPFGIHGVCVGDIWQDRAMPLRYLSKLSVF